ncbi:MAG: hypothetical protein IKU05_05475 [Bacteroidales bacterium]|nr:hypothetical protein [Bacteroidales bacterium]MBR6438054.1 hypothetical protein [Bacteroidales bacterium]
MRTIAEIKKTMTDAALADATLVQALNLDTTKSWDAQVSAVSVINILFFVVAVGHYAMEWMYYQFAGYVEERIAAAYPGSVSWLYNRALEFQDDDEANNYYAQHGKYASIDATKQIVKHVAVVEKFNMVTIKVSGQNHEPLTALQLDSFGAYMNNLKFAGVHLAISSIRSDDLSLTLHIWRDRLVMPTENDAKIQSAVTQYLDDIKYGGTFNKTKLIDVLQAIPGVTDVTIEGCVFDAYDSNTTHTVLDGQNYESIAGHITLNELTVHYE